MRSWRSPSWRWSSGWKSKRGGSPKRRSSRESSSPPSGTSGWTKLGMPSAAACSAVSAAGQLRLARRDVFLEAPTLGRVRLALGRFHLPPYDRRASRPTSGARCGARFTSSSAPRNFATRSYAAIAPSRSTRMRRRRTLSATSSRRSARMRGSSIAAEKHKAPPASTSGVYTAAASHTGGCADGAPFLLVPAMADARGLRPRSAGLRRGRTGLARDRHARRPQVRPRLHPLRLRQPRRAEGRRAAAGRRRHLRQLQSVHHQGQPGGRHRR